jgi:serine/threonine-protein kinase
MNLPTSAPQPAPPRHLDRYEVLSELGRGAMGVVYKAQDPVIDRIVALKTICLEEPGSETDAWRQRFYREAKSAGRLNHPNIVTIYDVGESKDVAYIAMEFLGGQSLREILDSGTVLPPATIADIAAQVADGLAFAHQNGVVHRDIKPANIMVLDSGVVKITDFGIARLPSGTRTVAGTIFGSPKYISPERLQGLEVDGRSDVFSLGAVLYEMLTDFPPFFGGDLGAIMHQVMEVMPAPPSTRNRRIPAGFDYIIAKALAKRPEDRYPDAAAMAADLRNFADLKPPFEAPGAAQAHAAEAAPWREGDPTLRLPAPEIEAMPGALARSKAKLLAMAHEAGPPIMAAVARSKARMFALARDPRVPTFAISGLAVVAVIAIAGWAFLPGRVSNAKAPEAPITTSSANPAAPEAVTLPADVAKAEVTPATAAPVIVAQKAPAPVPDKPLHRVALAVVPWGEIYVNGKKIGVSPPMTELKLAPGRYAIEIRNTTFEPYHENIDVQNSTNVKIKHRFQ